MKGYHVVNRESSERDADGLAKHIRSIGGSARITKRWGKTLGGRRIQVYVVWEKD